VSQFEFQTETLPNQESLRLQYTLQHRAREFGWHEADIDVIDSDLGMSGPSGRSPPCEHQVRHT
jgi:hypothetical protein